MLPDLQQDFCAKCKRQSCIAMCHGCKSSFCGKHFIKHRFELAAEMETLRDNFSLLQNDLDNDYGQHPLWTQIDQWERDAMKKIRDAAEEARENLRQWLKTTTNEMKESVQQIDETFCENEKSDNFTEDDLRQCREKIENLREALDKPTTIVLIEDKRTIAWILPIKMINYKLSSRGSVISAEERSFFRKSHSLTNEHWTKVFGPCELSDDGLVVRQRSYRAGLSQVTGTNEYSQGQHIVDIFIEKKGTKNIFIGILSASNQRQENVLMDSSLNGWWNVNHKIINGESFTDENPDDLIQTGDQLFFSINCDTEMIELKPCRSQSKFCLPIQLTHCPFPWKIAVRLVSDGDCLRLLA